MKDSTPDEKLTLCGHCHKMTRGIPTCGECGGWREDNTSDELEKILKGLIVDAIAETGKHLGKVPIHDTRIEPVTYKQALASITQKLNEAERRGRSKALQDMTVWANGEMAKQHVHTTQQSTQNEEG